MTHLPRRIFAAVALSLLLASCTGGLPTRPVASTPTRAGANNPPRAASPSAPASAAIVASPARATPAASELVVVFALLADNHLLAIRATDGATLADDALAPPPAASRGAGQYLALSPDGRRLYALAPGSPDMVAIVDVATFAVLATYSLPADGAFYLRLAVGPVSGRPYLFGERADAAIVTVLDPATGAALRTWVAHPADGHDWQVYQGAVAADERTLYLSYHGTDTTGIDRLAITPGGLQRCAGAVRPDVGCIAAHGDFALYGDDLLLEMGDTSIIFETDQAGRILRGYDTRLTDNHLLAFAVDPRRQRLYASGWCTYVPGFSAVDLRNGGLPTLTATPGVWRWATPAASPAVVQSTHALCGPRLALGPAPLVAIARNSAVPAVLLVDGDTGQIVHTAEVPTAPVDVLVVPGP